MIRLGGETYRKYAPPLGSLLSLPHPFSFLLFLFFPFFFFYCLVMAAFFQFVIMCVHERIHLSSFFF